MSAQVIVLLSGGQDSATCLALAKEKYSSIHAICFDYGQRHKCEIEQAEKLAKIAGATFQIIRTDLLSSLTENSLTNPAIPIETKSGELPSTFVPGRNHFFLSMAAIVAYQMKTHTIYTGVCQTDYSGYPDCREPFIRSLAQTLSLALEYPIYIETPLMYLTKAQTVQLMQKLGRLDWYGHTHTCYEGAQPPCGECPACVLRSKGFEEAGLKDPLVTF